MIIFVSNIKVLIDIVAIYGGLVNAVKYFGDTLLVTKVQQGMSSTTALLLSLNYFLPVLIVPIIIKRKTIEVLLILFFPLVMLFILSSLCGTRIIFIDVFVSWLVVKSLTTNLNFPRFLKFFSITLVAIACLSYLQAARKDSNLIDGFNELGKYYSISLSNGAQIIKNGDRGQPLYWTLRSTFSVPIISQLMGTQLVYEGLYGEVPIRNRRDDFEYVKNLGIDPNYNTLGIYGYSFLDMGVWSVLLLTIYYMLLFLVYRIYLNGGLFGLLFYPVSYSLVIDQLRTNGIFSTRVSYFMAASLVIYLLNILSISYTRKRISVISQRKFDKVSHMERFKVHKIWR